MSTLKKIFLWIVGLFVGLFIVLPLLIGVIVYATRTPEEKAIDAQRVAAEQAQQNLQRAEKEKANEQANAEQRAKSEQTMLVARLCRAAQEAVEARLRAPATAKFPDCVWGANEYEIRANPEQTEFAVIGHVDSQNGFGALIRSRFVVRFQRQEGGLAVSQVAVE